MTTEQHAQTFIFRQGEVHPCDFCGENVDKNLIWLIPDVQTPGVGFPNYMGQPKGFHIVCAIKILTIMAKNRGER